MTEIWSIWDDGPEDVPEHATIHLAVLGLGGSTEPGHIEDVGHIVQSGELGFGVGWIGDIALDIMNGMIGIPVGSWAASDAIYLPWSAGRIGEWEDLG